MKQIKKIRGLALVLALCMAFFAGCGAKTDSSKSFANSDGITENGFWEGIKATKYVKLCDYKGITVPSETREITDDAVQSQIDSILQNYTAKEQVTDRAIADGDSVNIDYVGSVDGVAFDGGSTEGAGTDVVIGVTNYIDDFLQQLIGHKPGESFDIEVTFPDAYSEPTLSGKDAVFAITVNYITETSVPELTDAFVSEKLTAENGWTTVTEMRAGILSDLQDEAVIKYIQDYVVENSTIKSLPKAIMDYQQNAMVLYYQTYADQYGMELDEFLKTYVGYASKDELLENNLEANTKNANYSLIIQAIAEKEGISANSDDVTAYFAKYYKTSDYSDYVTTYGMPKLVQVALYENVLQYLKSNTVSA